MIVAVGNDGQFARFARVLGRPDLARDERFRTNADRVRNRDVLVPHPLRTDRRDDAATSSWRRSAPEACRPGRSTRRRCLRGPAGDRPRDAGRPGGARARRAARFRRCARRSSWTACRWSPGARRRTSGEAHAARYCATPPGAANEPACHRRGNAPPAMNGANESETAHRRPDPGRPARVHGVDHLFCVPGESYLAVLDALHDATIDVTVCRQEGGAAMMAEAYGKLTGRPGICFVTRGPGATNASPGLHIARQDSTPMILFVGQIDTRHARARGVPGTRLPRRLRLDRQMGDGDRRSRPAFPNWSRAPSTSRRAAGPAPW